MALPTVQAVGSYAGNTANVTITLPTHAANDILLLFIETCGGEAISLPAGGWAHVDNSPQATGSGTAGTRLSVLWLRAAAAGTTNPVITDAGNHTGGVAVVIRGCPVNTSPFDLTAGNVKASASFSTSIAGVVTTGPERLLLYASARDNDSASANWSSEANANLASLTEQFDAGTAQGNGGGVGIWSGTLAAAGASGTLTATSGASTTEGFLCLAMVGGVGLLENVKIDDIGNGVTELMNQGWIKISESLTAQMIGGGISVVVGSESLKIAETNLQELTPLRIAVADESLKVVDTVTTVNNLGVSVSEALKVVDTAAVLLNPLETSQAEALNVVDTLTALQVLLANLSESLTLSDLGMGRTELIGTLRISDGPVSAALVTGNNLATSISEALKLADTVTAARGLTASVSEAVTPADSLTASRDLTASLTESLVVADTSQRTLDPEESSPSESLKITDTVSASFNINASPSEAVRITDTATPTLNPLNTSLSESVRVIDTVSAGTAIGPTLITDTIKIADTVTVSRGLTATPTESVRVIDTPSTFLPLLVAIVPAEGLKLNDRVVILSVSINEEIRLSDANQGGGVQLRGVIHVVDTISAQMEGNLPSIFLTEGLTVSDSLTIVRTPLETLLTEVCKVGIGPESAAELVRDEFLSLEDTLVAAIGSQTDLFVSVSELFSITDTITARRTLEVAVTPEAVLASDSATGVLDLLASASESGKLADSASAIQDQFQTVTESLGIAETASGTLNPEESSASEGVVLADVAQADLLTGNQLSVNVPTEVLHVVESLTALQGLQAELAETLLLADAPDVEGPPILASVADDALLVSDTVAAEITPLVIAIDEESIIDSDEAGTDITLALTAEIDPEGVRISHELVLGLDLSADPGGVATRSFDPASRTSLRNWTPVRTLRGYTVKRTLSRYG